MYKFLNESEINNLKYNLDKLKSLYRLKLISESNKFREKVYSKSITLEEFLQVINDSNMKDYSIKDIKVILGEDFLNKLIDLVNSFVNKIINDYSIVNEKDLTMYLKNISLFKKLEIEVGCSFIELDKVMFNLITKRYEFDLETLSQIEKLIEPAEDDKDDFCDNFYEPVSYYFSDIFPKISAHLNVDTIVVNKGELIYEPDSYIKYFSMEYDYLADVILGCDNYDKYTKIEDAVAEEDDNIYFDVFESDGDFIAYIERDTEEFLFKEIDQLFSIEYNPYDTSVNEIYPCKSVVHENKNAVKWEFNDELFGCGLSYKMLNLLLIILGGF